MDQAVNDTKEFAMEICLPLTEVACTQSLQVMCLLCQRGAVSRVCMRYYDTFTAVPPFMNYASVFYSSKPALLVITYKRYESIEHCQLSRNVLSHPDSFHAAPLLLSLLPHRFSGRSFFAVLVDID